MTWFILKAYMNLITLKTVFVRWCGSWSRAGFFSRPTYSCPMLPWPNIPSLGVTTISMVWLHQDGIQSGAGRYPQLLCQAANFKRMRLRSQSDVWWICWLCKHLRSKSTNSLHRKPGQIVFQRQRYLNDLLIIKSEKVSKYSLILL